MTKHESVQELFSRAAEKFRNETAIIQSGQSMTYGELEDRSNSLANFLISKGFTKGSVVSILADRAAEMITAIIATLKAGGAFVPLDPTMPQHRLNAMVRNVDPGWFLVESKFLGLVDTLAESLDGEVQALNLDGCEVSESLKQVRLLRRIYNRFRSTQALCGHGARRHVLRLFHVRLDGTTEGNRGTAQGHRSLHPMGNQIIERREGNASQSICSADLRRIFARCFRPIVLGWHSLRA